MEGLDSDLARIAGFMSFMCCDTTARNAHSRGYKVLFVQDATATIDLGDIPAADVHGVTVAVQGFMFSEVVLPLQIPKADSPQSYREHPSTSSG
ncbi:MAG: isochorismatase family protein [bacterium]|nr:isochorismatase family protein [bacterium]